ERVSRSTCSRRWVENAWMVVAVLYLRRLKRRSTTCWMRRRAGRNRAATARVEASHSERRLPCGRAEELAQAEHAAGVDHPKQHSEQAVYQGAVDEPVNVEQPEPQDRDAGSNRNKDDEQPPKRITDTGRQELGHRDRQDQQHPGIGEPLELLALHPPGATEAQ